MVSRLNPVTIRISFPRKTYSLGDTVNVMVHITAQTDVAIREARIGLECQIRCTEMRAGISRRDAVRRGRAGDDGMLGAPPQTINVPFEVELSDTYPSQTFLTNRRLQARRTYSSSVLMEIPSELARNGAYAQSMARPAFSWRVVVTADVSLARDVIESSTIDMALGRRETD